MGKLPIDMEMRLLGEIMVCHGCLFMLTDNMLTLFGFLSIVYFGRRATVKQRTFILV